MRNYLRAAECINSQHCLAEKVLPRSAPVHLRSSETPFSESARIYLEEACENLTHRYHELTNSAVDVVLPQRLIVKLEKEDNEQKIRLQSKLEHLCENSEWKKVGKPNLITNLSDRQLTNTEIEVLEARLHKFHNT